MANLDELEKYGKRYSRYVAIVCPYHDDHNPSLFAYEDRFHCAACGKHGKISELLIKLGGQITTVKKDTKYSWFNRWLGESSLSDFCYSAYEFLRKNKAYRYYLEGRGIGEAIDPLQIGYWDGFYIIPVLSSTGEIVSAVARAGEDVQSRTGMRYVTYSSGLFSPDWLKVRLSSYVVLPFGIIDGIVAHLIGYPVIVNLTGKQPSADLFTNYRKQFFIIPDDGEEKYAHQLASELSWRGKVIRIDYPVGTKDIADIWKTDPKALMEMLSNELDGCLGDRIRTDIGRKTISTLCPA